MKIQIRYQSNYGTDHFYPDCPISDKFVKLTKTKTLSETDLMTIESLGYKIEMHQLSWKNIKH